jgi:hypothetical protein
LHFFYGFGCDLSLNFGPLFTGFCEFVDALVVFGAHFLLLAQSSFEILLGLNLFRKGVVYGVLFGLFIS